MKKLITILAAFLVINAAHAQIGQLVVGSGADTMTNTTALTLTCTGSIPTPWIKGYGAFVLNTVLVSGNDTGYIIVQRSYDNSHWGSAAGDTTNMKNNTSYNYYIPISYFTIAPYYRLVFKGTAATAKLAVGYARLVYEKEITN